LLRAEHVAAALGLWPQEHS